MVVNFTYPIYQFFTSIFIEWKQDLGVINFFAIWNRFIYRFTHKLTRINLIQVMDE